jgi:biotin synthase
MNFLHPIPGTPCGDRAVLSTHEAVRIVALFRLLLPDAALRVCGGRQDVFPGPAADLALAGGADGVMIGDYLTLKGTAASEDLAALRRLGLEPAVPGSDVPEGGGPGNGRSEWSAREAEK